MCSTNLSIVLWCERGGDGGASGAGGGPSLGLWLLHDPDTPHVTLHTLKTTPDVWQASLKKINNHNLKIFQTIYKISYKDLARKEKII